MISISLSPCTKKIERGHNKYPLWLWLFTMTMAESSKSNGYSPEWFPLCPPSLHRYVSSKIPLTRSLPMVQMPNCSDTLLPSTSLQPASLIIAFHNEAWFVSRSSLQAVFIFNPGRHCSEPCTQLYPAPLPISSPRCPNYRCEIACFFSNNSSDFHLSLTPLWLFFHF